MFSDALIERILDRSEVARLAQLDNDASVQALPFVFVRYNNALWSPIDGKPKRTARLSRLDWIAHYPKVCVLIDEYAHDWQALWWLKLYGMASIEHEDHIDWGGAADGLARKYPQYEKTPMFLGVPTMIRFQWDRCRSWAAAGDTAMETGFR